jgi:hypothetical protein
VLKVKCCVCVWGVGRLCLRAAFQLMLQLEGIITEPLEASHALAHHQTLAEPDAWCVRVCVCVCVCGWTLEGGWDCGGVCSPRHNMRGGGRGWGVL